MRNLFLFCVAILWMATASLAQVSISSDNSVPDASAMLDVKSTSKGALLPRMTFEQRNAIVNPAEGLMVYCTNCNPDGAGCVSIFENSLWKTVNLNCYSPNIPAAGIHNPSVTQIIWNWITVPIAVGYRWNTVNEYNNAIDVGTATLKTETGLTCFTSYTRYVWAYNDCGHSNSFSLLQSTSQVPSSAPSAGTHTPSLNQIVWNWNSVSGATGYKWNTDNNYATAVNMGAGLSKTETSLTCNTLYTRYVWAYNLCGGISTSTTLTQATMSTPVSAPTAGIHVPLAGQIIWNWNPVAGATGYKWSTTNNYATAANMGASLSKTETGLTCNTLYTRYVWAYNLCGGIPVVTTLTQATSNTLLSPDPGTNVPSQNQIVWHWNSVSGATGYKWNTINNYSTAMDMGASTQKTETGFSAGTTYTRYVWAYNTCGISAPTALTQTFFYIGQSYGGGYIFYIDGTGQHGLIATPGDQSTDAPWGCYGTSIPGTSTAIGTGLANTTAIVNGCSTAGIAARLCSSLIYPVLNPYFDWFLPSKDELNQLYIHKDVVGGFGDGYYWSSSEYDPFAAYYQHFTNGGQSGYYKTTGYFVRAVRAF